VVGFLVFFGKDLSSPCAGGGHFVTCIPASPFPGRPRSASRWLRDAFYDDAFGFKVSDAVVGAVTHVDRFLEQGDEWT
jgi:hypothetical protein